MRKILDKINSELGLWQLYWSTLPKILLSRYQTYILRYLGINLSFTWNTRNSKHVARLNRNPTNIKIVD